MCGLGVVVLALVLSGRVAGAEPGASARWSGVAGARWWPGPVRPWCCCSPVGLLGGGAGRAVPAAPGGRPAGGDGASARLPGVRLAGRAEPVPVGVPGAARRRSLVAGVQLGGPVRPAGGRWRVTVCLAGGRQLLPGGGASGGWAGRSLVSVPAGGPGPARARPPRLPALCAAPRWPGAAPWWPVLGGGGALVFSPGPCVRRGAVALLCGRGRVLSGLLAVRVAGGCPCPPRRSLRPSCRSARAPPPGWCPVRPGRSPAAPRPRGRKGAKPRPRARPGPCGARVHVRAALPPSRPVTGPGRLPPPPRCAPGLRPFSEFHGRAPVQGIPGNRQRSPLRGRSPDREGTQPRKRGKSSTHPPPTTPHPPTNAAEPHSSHPHPRAEPGALGHHPQ